MDETVQSPKQPGSKKIAAIVIAAIVVIGGAAAAFAFMKKSPKEQYFLAEKNSLEFIQEQVEKRYEPELNWAEKVRSKPTKTEYELSAKYDDPNASAFNGSQEADIINNSSLKVKTETDYKAKIAKADLTANFNGLEIGGIRFGLTKDELTAKIPFVKDTFLVKDKDLPKLVSEFDPTFDKDQLNIDFADFFQQELSEKDQEYLKKEYLDMIYDEIPEEAFETAKEEVKIDNDAVKAEKIKMHLTEKQVKGILTKVLNKAEKDQRLKDIIVNYISLQNFGLDMSAYEENGKSFESQLEDSFREMKEDLKDAKIPNGLTSTIWVSDDLIVKRDFSIKAGPDNDNLTKLSVNGTQKLTEEKQTFDYDLKSKDDFSDDSIKIKGDFAYKNNKAKDSAEISMDEGKLSYQGDEKLKGDKRTFDRVFTFKESTGTPMSLTWSGDADYDKDSMSSNNELRVDATDLGAGDMSLFIKKNASNVKSVDKPKKDNVVDFGSMTSDEIEAYFANEVIPAIQKQFGF